MASSEIEVKVAVEAALHQAIRQTLQQLSDQHRIRVESIDVQWCNMIGGMATILELKISSTS